jgi:hypothetical protein
MATEKYFVFSESGELKRMKGRIVRFLDNEDPSGSDKSAIRTSLEVSPDAAGLVQADIGTAPNEIPVNGMLGDMAYQSSEGISVAKAEVETLEVTDKVTGPLTVSNTSAATSFILANSGGGTTLNFAVTENTGGIIDASENATARNILFKTGGTERWRINASGNLVAGSGLGINFGAVPTSGPSPSSSTLDDYEEGTWTPVFAPNSGSFTTATTYVYFAKYTKVGNVVTANCYIRTDGTLDTTGGSGAVVIQGLPFTSPASTDFVSVNVGYAYNWSAAPAGGYISSNTNRILLTKRASSITGNLTGGSVSDLDTSGGARNEIMISVTYQTT